MSFSPKNEPTAKPEKSSLVLLNDGKPLFEGANWDFVTLQRVHEELFLGQSRDPHVALGIRDCGRHKLGERGEARLSVAGQRLLQDRADAHHPPHATLDDDRRPNRRADTLFADRTRKRSRRIGVAVDPGRATRLEHK